MSQHFHAVSAFSPSAAILGSGRRVGPVTDLFRYDVAVGSSSRTEDTFKTKLPFPSRPSSSSIETATSTRRRASLLQANTANLPQLVRSYSATDSLNSNSSSRSEEAIISQGARVTVALSPSRLDSYDVTDRNSDARGAAELEKRVRLTHFLDVTASMMEGGKSLAMVLPPLARTESSASVQVAAGLTFAGLSEATGGSPQLVAQVLGGRPGYPHSLSPLIASPASSPSDTSTPPLFSSNPPPQAQLAPPRRRLQPNSEKPVPLPLYHLPGTLRSSSRGHSVTSSFSSSKASSLSTRSSAPWSLSSSLHLPDDEIDLEQHAAEQATQAGLGLDLDFDNLALACAQDDEEHVEAEEQNAGDETVLEDLRAHVDFKRADKRRRTIRELLETEASYASDMAIVRDIYLARAKGAGKPFLCGLYSSLNTESALVSKIDILEIADQVMSSGLGLQYVLKSTRSHSNTDSESSPSSPTVAHRSSLSSRPTRPLHFDPTNAVMSPQELHVIFANLEEIAQLAQEFSGVLSEAAGEREDEDSLGRVFIEMVSGLLSFICQTAEADTLPLNH